jgi:lipopolysaccharide transport system ATP-binding protein
MRNKVIECKNITKVYKLYERNLVDRFKDAFFPGKIKRHSLLYALKQVNLSVYQGEILGIVGRNGAGKSTLVKVMSGITQQTSGALTIKGKISPLLELGGGFDPDFSGRENIYFYCSLQGMNKTDIERIYPAIVEFSELEDFIDVPVKKYSSGMRARLGFAVSVNINPDILILDEVLSVGDELFKRKCFVKMEEFFSSGKTIIFITHSAQNIINICHRAVLMHKGELLLDGQPEFVIRQYRRLLNAKKSNDDMKTLLEDIRLLNQDNTLKNEQQEKFIKNKDVQDRIKEDIPYFNKPEAYYLDGFESKSVKLKKNKDVDIINYNLLNTKGQAVNHLIAGDTYHITFSARFNEPVEKVQQGCLIYNDKSIILSGNFSPSKLHPVQYVQAGEVVVYKTSFIAALKPGIYGIQFIVRGIKNKKTGYISSLRDALLFRIIEEKEDQGRNGFVNLFIT